MFVFKIQLKLKHFLLHYLIPFNEVKHFLSQVRRHYNLNSRRDSIFRRLERVDHLGDVGVEELSSDQLDRELRDQIEDFDQKRRNLSVERYHVDVFS